MDCSMPGLPVHLQLPEFTQTHVHRVGDGMQPSQPLSSPSPPAPNLSRIRVFSNESTLCHFQGKPFSITVIQVYAPTTNTEEAEAERFYEDLQDLLELPGKCSVPRPGSPVPSTPERREGLRRPEAGGGASWPSGLGGGGWWEGVKIGNPF